MKDRIPYTYCIRHIASGKKYYGVRYKKGCHPGDLGVSYTSSSRTINEMITQEGIDAFQFEIRRTFNTPEEARNWEMRVLHKLHIPHNPNWFNKTDGKNHRRLDSNSITQETRRKIGLINKGKKFTSEHCKNLSVSHLGHKPTEQTIAKMRLFKLSPEHKEKLRAAHFGKTKTPEQRENLRKARIAYLNRRREQ